MTSSGRSKAYDIAESVQGVTRETGKAHHYHTIQARQQLIQPLRTRLALLEIRSCPLICFLIVLLYDLHPHLFTSRESELVGASIGGDER